MPICCSTARLSNWTGDHFREWTVRDGTVTPGRGVNNFPSKTKNLTRRAKIHLEFATGHAQAAANPQYLAKVGRVSHGPVIIADPGQLQKRDLSGRDVCHIYSQFPPLVEAARPAGNGNGMTSFSVAAAFGHDLECAARMTVNAERRAGQDNVALIRLDCAWQGGVYAPHAAECRWRTEE
jgi:hypothetical protein